MRFGLQRSVIFWAGVLMTVFIGWAARDSREHASGVRAGACQIASVCGGVAVEWSAIPWTPFWEADRNAAPRLRETLESPFFLRGQGHAAPKDWSIEDGWTFQDLWAHGMSFQNKGDWMLFLPYWLLWMVMGVVWVVLLVWRQRRGRGVEVEMES